MAENDEARDLSMMQSPSKWMTLGRLPLKHRRDKNKWSGIARLGCLIDNKKPVVFIGTLYDTLTGTCENTEDNTQEYETFDKLVIDWTVD